MVTISHLVKKYVDSKPLLMEALSQNIVNFANLAEQMQDEIEKELDKRVKTSAIVMALRRYAEQMEQKSVQKKKFNYDSEIIMKTNLCDVTVLKNHQTFDKIKRLQNMVDYEKGDILNIIQGNYEITIILPQKYQAKLKELLAGEKILNIQKDLVSITLHYSKDFFYTPGVLANITRKLAWENINVFENISTMTELTFIVSSGDATRAYNVMQAIVQCK